MTPDSVNQLVKLMQTRMQNEYDLLNEEIGLEKKYLRVVSEDLVDDEAKMPDDLVNLNENDFDMDMSMTADNLGNESVRSDDNNNSITEDCLKKYK